MSKKHTTLSLFGAGEPPEPACGHAIRVALESAADTEFDYLVSDDLWPIAVGQRVEVPFGRGNKPVVGFCVASDVAADGTIARGGRRIRLKRVARVVDEQPLLGPDLMALARWISAYYVSPLGQVLAAMVPGAVKRAAGVKRQRCVHLLAQDAEALGGLRGDKQKQIVEVLRDRQALTPQTALEMDELTAAVDCRPPTVKRLAQKLIVKFTERKILSALPVVPVSMANEPHEGVLNADQRRAARNVSKLGSPGPAPTR